LQFQLLLNTAGSYVPLLQRPVLSALPSVADTASFGNHPMLQAIRQQQSLADANYALEKSKLLPNLSLNYNNTTIRGVGADNKLYDGSTRFGAVQLGVGIPVFKKGQKNLIEATRFSRQVAESNYEAELRQFKTQYEAAYRQYLQNNQSLRYYESEGIPNAQQVVITAGKQLQAGQINYLEWVQLINQSIHPSNQYLETQHNTHISVVQLNYLLAQ
jgi:cobalt-zinc-cadmium resistance protein CzcA